MRTATLFGLSFLVASLPSVAKEVVAAGKNRERSLLFTANVDHIVLLSMDERFKKAYNEASFVTADGMPVVWLGRLLGIAFPERVAGSDLLLEVATLASEQDLTVFLLGGAQGIPEKAADRLKALNPGLKIVGALSPSMGFEKNEAENQSVIKEIDRTNPDILLVGFGAPRQEIWLVEHRFRMRFGVAIGVGGTFDFLAGNVRRAPKWMQTMGLEWFFRLSMEPRRLWKRYLVRDLRFVILSLREILSSRKKSGKNA